MPHPAMIRFPGVEALGRFTHGTLALAPFERRLDGGGDARRNLVLHRKNIGEIPVVVENGVAPGGVVATGVNFTTAPTTRQRPLCPYPQQARFIGGPGGDLSVATNYECHRADKAKSSTLGPARWPRKGSQSRP
jgi:hypothetical protein